MAGDIESLLSILDLEPIEQDLFRGHSPRTRWQRVFGGQVIGQALVAACRTIEDRAPHSLHAYFIRPGDPNVPILYKVERLRDGRSFSTRRVTAIQHGVPIYEMMVSFHVEEDGFDHQFKMPDVPPPEALDFGALASEHVVADMPLPIRNYFTKERELDLRPVEFRRYMGQALPDAKFNVWIRVATKMPDDPAIHRCALAFASDMTLLDVSLSPMGRTVFEADIAAASLDHAMWFHRPFRADEWMLYAQDSPNASGARGLGRGLIFRRDGALIASVAQEGLIRVKKVDKP